jgi:predicted MFS family arabinose efflux permease
MTSVSPSPPLPTMPSGMVALRIVLVFAVGYFLSYAMRSVNAAIAPLLVSDLSLSASELGWLSSAYILSFSAMQIPVGIWLDRYGARRTESTLLLVAALGAALTAIGETLWVQSAGRILIGVGVSACLMAAYSYFRRCFPAERQPRLVMYMLISGTSGALVASQPALALAEWIGWRHVFSLTALMFLLCAAAIFTFTGDLDRQAGANTRQITNASFFTLCRHPFMVRILPATVFTIGGFGALQTLWAGPWFTQILGMSPDRASQTLLYMNASILCSYFLMGELSPRLIKRGVSLLNQSVGALIWLPVCIGLITFWQHSASWILWLILAPAIPAMFLLQTQAALEFPSTVAGRVLTTYNLLVFAGTFIVQWGFGALTDLFQRLNNSPSQSLTYSMACLVTLQVLGLIWFFIKKPDGSIRT